MLKLLHAQVAKRPIKGVLERRNDLNENKGKRPGSQP